MPRRPKAASDSRVIELTQGHVAIVDARDYEWLIQWRWRAQIGRDRYVYAVRQERIRERRFYLTMHQLLVGDVPPGHKIYHANGWGLDNRRCNLMVATPSMAEALRGKRSPGKTSPYKGVYLSHHTRAGQPRWAAGIGVEGRQIYLGIYESQIEAAEAHDVEAVRHFGPRAFVNFPEKMPQYLQMVQSVHDRWDRKYTLDETGNECKEEQEDWL